MPFIEITSPSDNSTINTTSFNLTTLITDLNSVNANTGITAKYIIDPAPQSLNGNCPLNGGVTSITITPGTGPLYHTSIDTISNLSAGQHTIYACAYNGTYYSLLDQATFTIDTSAANSTSQPSIFITLPGNGSVTGDITPEIRAVFSYLASAANYSLAMDPITAPTSCPTNGLNNSFISGSAQPSLIYSYPTALSDGVHNIYGCVTDSNGNISSLAHISFTVDTTNPILTIHTPAFGSFVNTLTPTLTTDIYYSGSTVTGAYVVDPTIVPTSCPLSGNFTAMTIVNGSSSPNYITQDSLGAFTSNTTHSVYGCAKDGSHNSILQKTVFTVNTSTNLADTIAPTVIIQTPADGSIVPTINPAINTYIFETAGVMASYAIDPTNTPPNCQNPLSQPLTVTPGPPPMAIKYGAANLTNLTPGQHTLYVCAVDQYLNISVIQRSQFTVDPNANQFGINGNTVLITNYDDINGNDTVTFIFNDSGNATGYNIYSETMSAAPGTTFISLLNSSPLPATVNNGIATVTYNMAALFPGNTHANDYFFRLTRLNGSLESSQSNIAYMVGDVTVAENPSTDPTGEITAATPSTSQGGPSLPDGNITISDAWRVSYHVFDPASILLPNTP